MISLVVLLIPLLTALFVMFTAARRVSLIIALVGTVTTFLVSMQVITDDGIRVPWISGFGVNFYLYPAGADTVLVTIAALVMIPTALWAMLKVEDRPHVFVALLLLMQTGLNGLFLAKDLILYYLFWEATLIPSLLLLGMWGREGRQQAAVKYLVYAVTGSFVMLVTILAIKPLAGAASYSLGDLLAVTPDLPLTTQLWLFAGFVLGFAVKLPLWPLHGWLPDFHAENHPCGAADVAGTLYKVGGFGFFAWAIPLLPGAASAAAPYLLAFAAVTAVYAATIASAQRDLKRLLAYASLSHMGVVGVGVFGLHIAGLNGAMFLLAAQMVTTGGLFLLSGMLYERRQTFDLSAYGGLARSAPALSAITLFVLFASIGVPGLANFPGEFLSLMGAFQTNAFLGAFATLSVVAAGVYGVNLYQRLYLGPEKSATRDIRPLELVVLAPLLVAILWLGLDPDYQVVAIQLQSRTIEAQLRTLPEPTEAPEEAQEARFPTPGGAP